jgi:hypothetical protein
MKKLDTTIKLGITIAIGVFLTLTAAAPSFAQSPPEAADYVQQGEPVPLFLDSKACAGVSRSTVGAGDIVEPPLAEEFPNDKLAAAGTVCPPPEFDPDIRIPLGNPVYWGHRPN